MIFFPDHEPDFSETFVTATSVGGGILPTYTWYLNNVAVTTGTSGTYFPTNGDVVYAVMTPNLNGSPVRSNHFRNTKFSIN